MNLKTQIFYKNFVIFFSLTLLFSSPSYGLTQFAEGLFKKQKDNESVRWTLADWLTQKKTFKAMDQWLAINKSMGRFELNVGGGKSAYDVSIGTNVTEHAVERGSISLYYSIFGIEYGFENSDEEWTRESGQINLRILGASSQTTNLTISYGVRKWEWENPVNELTQQFAGADLTLYIFSFLGIDGSYRKYMKDEDKNSITYEGDRVEYGAFIDLTLIRLYGTAFKENTTSTDASGTETETTRDGTVAGVKLFF